MFSIKLIDSEKDFEDVRCLQQIIGQRCDKPLYFDCRSKNFLLQEDGTTMGAIGIAFDEEHLNLRLDYLLTQELHRDSPKIQSLLGIVYCTMEANRFNTVFIDISRSMQLIYEDLGFQLAKEKSDQHVTSDEWITLMYFLGKDSEFEKRCVVQAQPHLTDINCVLDINLQIITCLTLEQYEECVRYLMENRKTTTAFPLLLDSADLLVYEKLEKIVEIYHLKHLITWSDYLKKWDTSDFLVIASQTVPIAGQNFIVCKKDSPLFIMARYYAVRTGRELVQVKDWAFLPEFSGSLSVVLFLEPEICDGRFFHFLKRKLSNVNWGIISGTTLQIVSWCILKNLLYQIKPLANKDLLLLFVNSPSLPRILEVTGEEHRHLDVFVYTDLAVDQLMKTLKTPVRMLLVESHGRGDIVYCAKQFYFCGRSSYTVPDIESFDVTTLPACVPQRTCYREGTPFLAEEANASVFFLNTCFAFSHIFPRQYTIGWSLLRSFASHVIASEIAKEGDCIENIFFYCLMKQGATFGEAVRILNSVLEIANIDQIPYLLFGDPFLKIEQCLNAEPIICFELEGVVKRITVHCQGRRYLVNVSMSIPEDIGTDNLYFYIKKRVYKLSYLYYVAEHKVNLFLFSGNILPEDFECYVTSRQTVTQGIRQVEFFLDNVRRGRKLNLCTNARKSMAIERMLEDEIANFAELMVKGKTLLYPNFVLLDKCKKMIESLLTKGDLLVKDILERITKQGWFIDELYSKVVLVRNLDPDNCYICGDILYRKKMSYAMSGETFRHCFSCATCGVIGDIPGEFRLPKFYGSDIFCTPGCNIQSVEIENPFTFSIHGHMGIRFYQSESYGISYAPEVAVVKVEPMATMVYQFKINLGVNGTVVPLHRLFLKGVAVIDGAILYFQKNIKIAFSIEKTQAEEHHTELTISRIKLSFFGRPEVESAREVVQSAPIEQFSRLLARRFFSRSYEDEYIIEHRHEDSRMQHEYDKRFGLACISHDLS